MYLLRLHIGEKQFSGEGEMKENDGEGEFKIY
jgi:hypothetical protein